ncbi:orotate phosphoribosyltransferase [Natronogracilivirga saccharolytica]|uniref:Orotate phosphoribosyltransferase n=1 Tax=Natronogracilivirga saccharolytica TaxID=2812953 RepID=A0A8J7RQK2_9BACT|nr:orotate phosphoribosyltransferase [Natronogracilivirga saccharolytica]MBP3191187.1 orotate phosphoribosyltransferase [Natronogracilivirga saccharolytica]
MISDKKFARELAGELLDINAVLLRPDNPFVWSSGWNSPIYCDNRLTILYPELRKKIAGKLSEIITDNYSHIDVVTGTATAGIPHTAWVADRLNKPMAYVRAKAKSYGMGNQIEGGVRKGESTVVIEDLISTGTSALSVVETLEFVGAKVDALLAIFTYGFDVSNEKIKEHNIPMHTLTDYATLVDVALEKDKIRHSDVAFLNDWRKRPDTWPGSE